MRDPALGASLLLERTGLLRRAVGQQLTEIERLLVVTPQRFTENGGERSEYFAAASGPTQFTFGDGLVHAFYVWPSQLSLIVETDPLADDEYAERHRLSQTDAAPEWLRHCLGQRVRAVQVYVYRDDVPSDEARQAAVSYALDSGQQLFYGMYLHGRLDSDELLPGESVPRDRVERTVALERDG